MCLHVHVCVQWGAVWKTGEAVQKKMCCSTCWWAKKKSVNSRLEFDLWFNTHVHVHVGLESVPEGLEAVLDVTGQNSPAFLRAKKKLEEYLPFETQLVSMETWRPFTHRRYLPATVTTITSLLPLPPPTLSPLSLPLPLPPSRTLTHIGGLYSSFSSRLLFLSLSPHLH